MVGKPHARLLTLALALGAIVGALLPGPAPATAGPEGGGVQRYSACVKPSGTDFRTSYLFNWTPGDTPSPACGSYYSQVNLAGGDISNREDRSPKGQARSFVSRWAVAHRAESRMRRTDLADERRELMRLE